MTRLTTSKLLKMKEQGQKIATITAYDASFANLFDEAGVHMMLIGDSLGMVLQGHNDTLPVSVDDIAYHTRCVAAGSSKSLIVADMPFMSYDTTENAYTNAATLMKAGANMIKMEGGDWLVDTVKGLTTRGIPVCAHLGLTPQSVHVFGGFKVQGKTQEQADEMLANALALEEAGAQLLVLECVPGVLAKKITDALTIPVIGIGAGVDTDGQILVMHDMFGLTSGYIPKFSKNYLTLTGDVRAAIQKYIEEVQSGAFPGPEQIIC